MKPAIWRWFDGRYKVYCKTKELRDKMLRWDGVVEGGTYVTPSGRRKYDVIVPESRVSDARKLLKVSTAE